MTDEMVWVTAGAVDTKADGFMARAVREAAEWETGKTLVTVDTVKAFVERMTQEERKRVVAFMRWRRSNLNGDVSNGGDVSCEAHRSNTGVLKGYPNMYMYV